MKRLICLLAVFATVLSLCGCHKMPEVVDEDYYPYNIFNCGVVPAKLDGKWGYINEKGETVVDFQFEYASIFSEFGVAAVKIDEKYGYIDLDGEWIVEPKFDRVYGFTSIGICRINVDGKYGYIDLNGKYICEPTYSFARDFQDVGVAAVRFGTQDGFINTKGKIVVEPVWGLLDNKFDSTGHITVHDEDGIAYRIDTKGRKTKYDGDIIIYDDMEFVNGLSVYRSDDKCGYVNECGKIVIEPIYDWADNFEEDGTAWVKLNGKIGKIDMNGEFVIEPIFDKLIYGEDINFQVVEINGKYGYINKQCEVIIDPTFDYAYEFHSGLALVKVDEEYRYINESGEFAFDKAFEDAWFFANNGLAPVKIDGLWGYINTSGEVVIEPQFEFASNFLGSVASIEKGEKMGFINENGEVIIEPILDYIYYYHLYNEECSGYFTFSVGEYGDKNRKNGFITTNGNFLDPKFDEYFDFRDDGYCVMPFNSKYGIMNLDGEWTVEPIYEDIMFNWYWRH